MRRVKWLLLGLALAGMPAATGCPRRQTSDKVPVAATLLPLADLARQVGGEGVEVATLVPPGVSPHGFDPSPRVRQALARARLVLSAGQADHWLQEGMVPSTARWVRLEEIAEHAGCDHEHHDHDHHDHEDPHYWLNPYLMAELAEQTGEALAQLDADRADEYRRRAAQYAAQCRALADEMRAAAENFTHKAFVAGHPAFTVMADMMGLEQIGSIQPVVGVQPSTEHLRHLVDQIVARGVPVVYVEPQLLLREAHTLQAEAARRGHAVKVLTLDPIGSPSEPGRGTYLENMRTNLAALREGLQQ